jgi:hypothetical protein
LSCCHGISLGVLLPHLAGVAVEAAEVAGGRVRIWARAGAEGASCPRCGQFSERVHSGYERRLADAPAGGQPVTIRLAVRRFFCGNPDCTAVTFAEQVEGLTSRRARRTPPLARTLTAIALALAGRAGARLAAGLDLTAGRSSMLRLVMTLPDPQTGTVKVLGVDLSRSGDYPDCWRGRGGMPRWRACAWRPGSGAGRDNPAWLVAVAVSLALPEHGAPGKEARQNGHGFVGRGRGPAGRTCGWLSA